MRPEIHGTRHAVSTGHSYATQAAFQMLEDGGNAIDAGVCAGIALGILQSDLVSIGGVAPIILYSAEEQREECFILLLLLLLLVATAISPLALPDR